MQVKDLSEIHHAITGMFPFPKSKTDWEQYRLSTEQVDFFNANGYLTGIKMLNEEQLEALREEVSDLADQRHEGNHLFYEYNCNESAVLRPPCMMYSGTRHL